MVEIKHDGPVKVIEARELEYDTERGWTVLEMFEVDTPSWDYEMSDRGCVSKGHPPRAVGDAYTGYSVPPQGPDVTPYFSVRQKRFLVGKTTDTRIAELKELVGSAERSKWEAINKNAPLQQELAAAKFAAEAATVAVTVAETRYDDAKERANMLSRALQQMEQDLAKVREAIGDARWREIVGRT